MPTVIVRSGALVLLLVLAVLSTSHDADAQPARSGKPARIGRLSPLSAEADTRNMQAFRKGLTDLGWVEGRTFVLESVFADGDDGRLPALAVDLARRHVDVILTGSTLGAAAAKKATSTIPIVMVTTGDPVVEGLVMSLARPGGNVTGITALGHVLNVKRLELMKQAVPGITRVGVLINPVSPYTPGFLKERDSAARALGVELRLLEAHDGASLEKVLTGLGKERVGAVMVQTNAFFITERRRIVDLIARSRLPAVYGERQSVDAGGLMFYGASLAEMYREAAAFADKVLKGARPADIPVEQPTKFELVINLKTARTLGITIPRSVLVRADQVIEQ